jgi:hypothetical protein
MIPTTLEGHIPSSTAQNFREIWPVEAAMIHAGTDGHDEVICAFRDYAKAPKNSRVDQLIFVCFHPGIT